MPMGRMFRVKRRRKLGRLTLKKVNRKITTLKNSIETKELYKAIEVDDLNANKVIVMNALIKGDDNGQREGNKIQCIKFNCIVRFFLKDNEWDGDDSTQTPWTLGADNASLVRVLVIVNKQNNGDAIFDLSEILRTGTTPVTYQTSLYNLDYVKNSKKRNKYTILYDRNFHLTPNQVGADRIIKINRSIRFNTLFNENNDGTGADIINNKIEVFILPNKVGTMNYSFHSVVSYTDI